MIGIDGGADETSWRGPRLRAETRQADGCLVMGLSGELDYMQRPEFRQWALGVVTGGHNAGNSDSAGNGDSAGNSDNAGHDDNGDSAAPMVVLDLRGIEFFDSTGLSVVIALWRQARDAGGDLAVAAPPPICANMMRRTGLADHIAMGDTVAAAIAGAAILRRTRSDTADEAAAG
ncbi:STAS domain-containing protein [Nonomuraea sp. NPDC001023]|uniref:STAS domain-containing protein n=1 Tax=unclassified Nonomuraea TaxID=2593643 RepID=UPI00333311E9